MQIENEKILESAIMALGSLNSDVVFVGGITTYLYVDLGVNDLRSTLDVDLIVNTDIHQYYKIEQKLREFGFSSDSDVRCRFHKEDLILDVMPIDAQVLGFTNSWYKKGFELCERKKVGEKMIRILSFPYFVATKIETFNARGQNDFFASKDMEDLISVLAGRPNALAELRNSDETVYSYFLSNFSMFMNDMSFLQSVEGNFPKSSHYNDSKQFLVELKTMLED